MIERAHYRPGPGSEAQFYRLWSAHVDALERHLSAKLWALAAVTVVMMVYPIGQMVVPAVLHAVVPDAVRTVLSLI